ncbi:polysaccharide deacetylase family protein [Mycolicibacterium sp. CBMA 234]|uniref:polysaccharide deacetylase family protein n=1 Tax=Mycolicibacterium sp. CBMA 234 TaxID=1918495 RepID=UPI001390F0AC|nr:polysaccharide deacetylase family protein [Mycolicibacterium sp. CBMA 234]
MISYLVAPGIWQWNHAAHAAEARMLRAQVAQDEVEPQPVDPAVVDRLRNATTSPQGAPLILTYHNIDEHIASRYSVTPELFEAQMHLLHDAGWTTLTANDLSNWLRGDPLPAHSVMITFDDGARGVWRYADRVLARYGQHAVAYIITGFVETHAPYYMTWPEITALQDSGRWDFEAHTHVGHVLVPVDGAGHQAPFVTNREYLADQNRIETLDEYHTRVLTDLTECKHQFSVHNLPTPRFFAYPFSAHGDDPDGTGLLERMVSSLYDAAMLDQADGLATTSANDMTNGNIERMDVTSDVTPELLADKLIGASPLNPSSAQPDAHAELWTNSDDVQASISVDSGHRLVLGGPPGHIDRQFIPLRTRMWNAYTLSADVGEYSHPGDGTTTVLSALQGDSHHQIDVSVDSDAYRIDIGYGDHPPLARGDLVPAPFHHIDITVAPAAAVITIDDLPPQQVSFAPAPPRSTAGGIGIVSDRQFVFSPPSVVANLAITDSQ